MDLSSSHSEGIALLALVSGAKEGCDAFLVRQPTSRPSGITGSMLLGDCLLSFSSGGA